MLKCSKPTMVNLPNNSKLALSIWPCWHLAQTAIRVIFFSSLGWIVGNVSWEDLEELWVFSNDSSGALSEELNFWVWSLSCQTERQPLPNFRGGKSSSATIHGETTPRHRNQSCVCVIVWLRLRYKHRWASKRTPQHILHVTMQSLCVRVSDCACTVQYVHVHTLTLYVLAPVC